MISSKRIPYEWKLFQREKNLWYSLSAHRAGKGNDILVARRKNELIRKIREYESMQQLPKSS